MDTAEFTGRIVGKMDQEISIFLDQDTSRTHCPAAFEQFLLDIRDNLVYLGSNGTRKRVCWFDDACAKALKNLHVALKADSKTMANRERNIPCAVGAERDSLVGVCPPVYEH